MEIEEHKKRHTELHQKLDELIADFIRHTEFYPSETKLTELMSWSHKQTTNPTDFKKTPGEQDGKGNY